MLMSFKEALVYNTVEDLTDHGKCTGCGLCCANFLPLSQSEIKEIHRYMKKHHIKEASGGPLKDEVLVLTCPFLDSSKEKDKCRIYPVRPQICKDFKCDQPAKQIGTNKRMYHLRYPMIDMREEFFE